MPHLVRATAASALLSGLLVSCVTAHEVRGPDGETAHLIRCGSTEGCLEKAQEICQGPYVIRSSGTGARWISTTNNMAAGMMTSSELLVSCKADLPESESPSTTAASSDGDREDSKVCDAAFAYMGDFAAYWSSRRPGSKLLEEMPEQRDFVSTCKAMPERAQRCMHDKFRVAHAKACDAVLLRLSDESRAKIDSLFLEIPSRKSDPPAPRVGDET